MLDNQEVGLFHHLSLSDRERVVGQLSVLYNDVYDAIESARDNVRDLEEELDVLFYGKRRERPIDEEWRKTRKLNLNR